MEAPDAIKWLNELGVMFDKDADGRMVTTHGGGTSRKRMRRPVVVGRRESLIMHSSCPACCDNDCLCPCDGIIACFHIEKECREGRGVEAPGGQQGVWLDTPMIELLGGEGTMLSYLRSVQIR